MAVIVSEYPHRPNIALGNPSAIKTMDLGKRRFRFTFFKVRTVMMYITFPKSGGVRIHNAQEGAFAPDSLCDIIYEDIDENSFKMTGNGTSVIFRSTSNTWAFEIYNQKMEYLTGLKVGCGPWDYSDYTIGRNVDGEPVLYRFEWPIAEKEEFFGFGERWNGVRQYRNQLISWNTDVISTSGVYSELCDEYCDKTQAYKNVPLIHSTRNYSMFYNSYLPIHFDMGYSNPNIMKTEIYGTQFDLYIWTGTPADNLANYHRLTGMPFIPPRWAFDYWLGGGAGYWNQPGKEHAAQNYENVLATYEKHGIRVTEAYVECQPAEDIFKVFQDRGIRMFMWAQHGLVPYGETEIDYADYYIKKKSDPDKVMNSNYIDFTSTLSKNVICDKFDSLWDNGVCGEMVDFSDSLPADAICSNGKDGVQMHNEYAYWFGRRMHEAFTERLGEDFVLFQRSGCAGSQHYTTSFGGDSYSCFLGLKRSVWQMLSAAASGFSIWGSDLGGYMLREWMPQEGPRYEELYIRWVQFSAFSALMRDHSCQGKHHPWTNGERGLANFKYYYALRLQLLDAIYSSALQCKKEGGSVADSMAIAYNMSPSIDMQYMFCKDFLVRPVVEEGQRTAEILFPEDGFYSLYDGTRLDTGKTEVEAPLDRIPVYVKAGSVIPFNIYPDDVIPTWDKDAYQEAVLLTVPQYERQSTIYTDQAEWNIVSVPLGEGFQVISDKPCSRHMVIVLGTSEAVLESDAEIISIRCEKDSNRTTFLLSSNWTMLHVK